MLAVFHEEIEAIPLDVTPPVMDDAGGDDSLVGEFQHCAEWKMGWRGHAPIGLRKLSVSRRVEVSVFTP